MQLLDSVHNCVGINTMSEEALDYSLPTVFLNLYLSPFVVPKLWFPNHVDTS